jgi:hypothetical protein
MCHEDRGYWITQRYAPPTYSFVNLCLDLINETSTYISLRYFAALAGSTGYLFNTANAVPGTIHPIAVTASAMNISYGCNTQLEIINETAKHAHPTKAYAKGTSAQRWLCRGGRPAALSAAIRDSANKTAVTSSICPAVAMPFATCITSGWGPEYEVAADAWFCSAARRLIYVREVSRKHICGCLRRVALTPKTNSPRYWCRTAPSRGCSGSCSVSRLGSA